ncbi:MAG TPA: glycosyltransferase [Acidimicrobiia bacterium]|nr:glycosyltransferase [Acidimicrobiia bacterium]
MNDATGLNAVLVTFDRPAELRATLEKVLRQSRRPDRLLVVDNGAAGGAGPTVTDFAGRGLAIELLDAPENLGPAGGFALGMTEILGTAGDGDWIVLLDDDDPPYFDDALERGLSFGVEQATLDPMTGAVGLSGGRFDPRRGRVVRVGDDEIDGAVLVDHITGGGLPLYRVGALRAAGVMRSELFFGYEELELGLRLTHMGYHIYADGDAWRERKTDKRAKGLLPPEEVSATRAARVSVGLGPTSWRRYYSLRNLIMILRETGHTMTAVKVSAARGVGKPLVNLFISPRDAWAQLRLGTRAVRDAWMGRAGRTVEPQGKRG